jgi:hypothetical protein
VYLEWNAERLVEESYSLYAGEGDREFNLIRAKTSTVIARIKDMMSGSAEAPFTLEPTPIPELSTAQIEEIQGEISQDLGRLLIENGAIVVDPTTNVQKPDFSLLTNTSGIGLRPEVREWLESQAVTQKKTAAIKASSLAKQATNAAEQKMKDILAEGNWTTAYLDSMFDCILVGTMCLRTEITSVPTIKWKGKKMEVSTEERKTYRKVKLLDSFPAPDATSANDGTYFIERVHLSKKEIYEIIDVDWFDKDAITEALSESKKNFSWLTPDRDEKGELIETPWEDDDKPIQVLIHEGSVRGEVLIDHLQDGEKKNKDFYPCYCKKTGNMSSTKDEDWKGISPHKYYDMEAYVLCDKVIGARIRPIGSTVRSYFSAQYTDSGFGFWGVGIAPLLMNRDATLNSYRDMLSENIPTALQPPIFYNTEAFDSTDDVKIEPKKLIAFSGDSMAGANNTVKPYYQLQLDPKITELTTLFNTDYRLADDECGIPSLLSGNSNLFGGEATFRGLKMLSQSANIGLKNTLLNIDAGIIEPVMNNLWLHLMMSDGNEELKADTKVIARGASGLLQRELASISKDEQLPILFEMMQGSGLPPETIQSLIGEMLKDKLTELGIKGAEQIKDTTVAQEQIDLVESVAPANIAPATPEPTIGQDQDVGGMMAGTNSPI